MSTQTLSILLAIVSFLIILLVGLNTYILKSEQGRNKPFSFHRFQLWLWSMIICPAFCLNWGFHPDSNPFLNQTSLILLGIAGGVVLTAEIINTAKQAGDQGKALKSNLADTASWEQTLNAERQVVIFWRTILIDDNGQLSMGRLQQFVFTFIYIVIYISFFLPEMNYPTFDNSAFILMGISAGTYLISKSQSK